MGHIQGENRHEVIFVPERLDDSMAEDTPVRFLEALVDELDLAACGFRRAVPAATGRPGYAPGTLLQRYLYGYLYRLPSSRRLEQETPRKVALMWRLKKLRPDHQTMANCRKSNLAPLRPVCRTFTLLGQQRDLFNAELVASDGSKFRAVNAQERTFTPDKLKKLIKPSDARAAALEAKIEALTQRKLRDEGFQTPLLSRGQEQRSLTDPESRAMKRGQGRGTQVCSNVQTAVDSKPKRSVACEGTNDPGDRAWLSPLALQAKDVLGGGFDAGADVGYDHGHAVKACLEAGITPSIPRPSTAAHEQ